MNDVLAKQKEIGHPIKRSGHRDHGVDSQQLASHAERQLSLTAKSHTLRSPRRFAPTVTDTLVNWPSTRGGIGM